MVFLKLDLVWMIGEWKFCTQMSGYIALYALDGVRHQPVWQPVNCPYTEG